MSWTPDELADLIDAHASVLTLYARQWSPNGSDVVQESLIELLTTRPRPLDPVAWMYTVVRRRAINSARSETRRQQHEHKAAIQRANSFEPSTDLDIDGRLVTLALEKLDKPEREIIVLRVWSGLKFEQIADVLETSVSSAHRRYASALRNLRKELGESCPDFPLTRLK